METKWIAICAIGVTAFMFAPLMVNEYQQTQCRVEAIKAGVPAADIARACGIK